MFAFFLDRGVREKKFSRPRGVVTHYFKRVF